jgi:hypothetical protein
MGLRIRLAQCLLHCSQVRRVERGQALLVVEWGEVPTAGQAVSSSRRRMNSQILAAVPMTANPTAD